MRSVLSVGLQNIGDRWQLALSCSGIQRKQGAAPHFREAGVMRHAVHAFTHRDVHIVYDGLSQTLMIVDDVGFEVVKRFALRNLPDMIGELADRFSEEDVRNAYEEIASLTAEGALFCDEDRLVASRDAPRPALGLSGICLHVAHDCNMRCSYCFAGSGLYGGKPTLMQQDTARAALDHLFRHAGSSAHVYVDFFGGEPLLNMSVVKDAIAYGNQLAKETERSVTWSMTTNGMLLDADIADYFNAHEVNLIISMDGRSSVHDAMRPDRQGQGTHDFVRGKAVALYQSRRPQMTRRYGDGVYTYIRGTFTRRNLDFAEDVIHLYEEGFRHIAMEPVVSDSGAPWTLSDEHVDGLKEQYDRLTDWILDSRRRGDPLHFHHFELDVERGPCLGKRASGCGAGLHYLAVSPEGDIYPCHQFVGNAMFGMGNVLAEEAESPLTEAFKEANFGGKAACQTCFARYHCGGGCHANHWLLSRDLLQPDRLSCELIRKRLECALFLAVDDATEAV